MSRLFNKCREATLVRADGVVLIDQYILWTNTTPSAPSKVASQHFLDVASTPPQLRRGVPFGCFATFQVHCVFTNPTVLPAEVRRSEIRFEISYLPLLFLCFNARHWSCIGLPAVS